VALCHARANFSEVKAVLNSILENLATKAAIEEGGLDCFIEGRRFVATVGGEPLCWAGEVKPEVLEAWDLQMPVAALEMNVEKLLELTSS
jgi:phenylalanyl-tRNA synthetase beta chain